MNCPWNKNVYPYQEPLAPPATHSLTLCPTLGSVISEDASTRGSCEGHFGILQRIINNSYILQELRFLNYQMGETSKVLHFIWSKSYVLYFRVFIRAFFKSCLFVPMITIEIIIYIFTRYRKMCHNLFRCFHCWIMILWWTAFLIQECKLHTQMFPVQISFFDTYLCLLELWFCTSCTLWTCAMVVSLTNTYRYCGFGFLLFYCIDCEGWFTYCSISFTLRFITEKCSGN